MGALQVVAQTVYTSTAPEEAGENSIIVVSMRSRPAVKPALKNFDGISNLAIPQDSEAPVEINMVLKIKSAGAE